MKIYELNKDIEQLLDIYYNCFDMETGEQTASDEELQNIQKQLEEKQNQKDELKTWILHKRANNIANVNWIKVEIDRLSEMLAYTQKQIERSDSFIEYLFRDTIKDKPLVFDNFKIGYRKSKSVELKEDFNVKEYIKERITYSPDKMAIKKDLESWKDIEWASIKENLNFYIK